MAMKQGELVPQIVTFEGVRGYVDANNVVQLNIEDIARGLGFTQTAKSGNEVVRWERVNRYLCEFGFIPTCGDDVKAGDYIPEHIFYLLAMKASNEAAKNFQLKIATEILPSIRKHGVYMTAEAAEKIISNPDFIIGLANQVKEARAQRDAALAQVAELKPKADYTEAVLESDEKLTSELIAKEYGHSAQWLHETMKSFDKMFKRGKKHWYMKAPFDKEDYRTSETIMLARGKTVVNHYWTQKGRWFIYNTLKAHGILPLKERESPMATLM